MRIKTVCNCKSFTIVRNLDSYKQCNIITSSKCERYLKKLSSAPLDDKAMYIKFQGNTKYINLTSTWFVYNTTL